MSDTITIQSSIELHLCTADEKIRWFGYGEWVEEPDEVRFEYKGFNCRIFRISNDEGTEQRFGGHLCGYINIPKDHPWHGKGYEEIDCVCHGGITYAKIEEDGEFWIGFDCAHWLDITPSIELMYQTLPSFEQMRKLREESNRLNPKLAPTYKNILFVKSELKELVDQAVEEKNALDKK